MELAELLLQLLRRWRRLPRFQRDRVVVPLKLDLVEPGPEWQRARAVRAGNRFFLWGLLEHGAEILQKTDALAATSRSPPKWLESRHANLLMRLTLQAGHEAGGESWKPSPTVAMAATTASVS